MDDVGYTKITGAEFYVMGFVEGRVLAGRGTLREMGI
jgi:hypothetical protein